MRALFMTGKVSRAELGRRYGLTLSGACMVVRDLATPGKRPGVDRSGENNGSAKITRAQAEEIRSLWAAGGLTQGQIGSRYGMTKGAVQAIITRRTWA
jgi:hypothetical protein